MFLSMLMQARAYVRFHANVTKGLNSSLWKYWPTCMSPAKITTALAAQKSKQLYNLVKSRQNRRCDLVIENYKEQRFECFFDSKTTQIITTCVIKHSLVTSHPGFFKHLFNTHNAILFHVHLRDLSCISA